MTDDAPATDARHPADVVVAMVEHVLGLAATWTRWDGTPAVVPVEGEPPRTYTPHKAVRRVADHLLDHLAEVEARLAGQPTEPDRWHGSMDQADDGAWTLRQVAFHVAGSDFMPTPSASLGSEACVGSARQCPGGESLSCWRACSVIPVSARSDE